MINLPLWIQFIIAIIGIGFIPMIVVDLIGTAKWFPKGYRSLLMIVGLLVVKILYRIMPLNEQVKNYAGITFFIIIILFLAWAIKNKWLWDKEY